MQNNLEDRTTWPQSLLSGQNNTGREILARDWSATSLGPIEAWPQSLRTALSNCFESLFPTFVLWGPDLIQFYNEASKPMIGHKDRAMGQGFPAKEYYPEFWTLVEPLFKSVLSGKSTWVQDQLLPIERYGFLEEAYFTFSYSPIRNERGDIAGVLCNAIETTRQVVNERRLKMLHNMALHLAGTSTVEEVCRKCMETLASNRQDLPYCVLRLLSSEDGIAKVMGSFGIDVPDRRLGEPQTSSYYPALDEVVITKVPVFISQVPPDVKIEADVLGREMARSAYVLPFFFPGSDEVDGFLSVGLNPSRQFDDEYQNFLGVLAAQIGTVISGAKAQEESRRKLAMLLDASPDHVFMLDRDGRYIYVNEAANLALSEALMQQGREGESPLGKTGEEMGFDAAFLKRFSEEQKRAFNGEAVVGETFFSSPKGLREFEYILSPMKDESGFINNLVGVTRDVQDLKNAIRVRDQFLSVASHELKTPLSSLKLRAQMRSRSLLRKQLDKFTPEKLSKMFGDDEVQVNRLNRLVDDMLDIARLNSGKFVLNPENFDLKVLVMEVVERIHAQIQNLGQFVTVTGASGIEGRWDRYRIEQVITNLLTNAMRYGGSKPISIEISKTPSRAVMVVRDRGMGIKKEDLSRIFQQFERAVSANEVSGLGLGLYIVKQILDAHGGTVSVESEIGEGSRFFVELPLSDS